MSMQGQNSVDDDEARWKREFRR